MDVAASLSTIKSLQAAFSMVQMLNLTAWRYPPPCSLNNGTKYDFIIVGSGTAGSVLANRLSSNSTINVLLVETGGFPPIEADDFPGLCPLLPRSQYDFDYYAQNDHCTAQNLHNHAIGLTAGKVLGGTGSIQHLLYDRGFKHDYDQWADIVNDDSWKYENIFKYFKNIENLTNENLRMSSYYQDHFGTDGIIDLTRESHPVNIKYLEAFKELGHRIENVTTTLGYSETLFNIGDGVRHSTALRYLGKAKSRSNLCMSLFTTTTKILITDGVAIGVQVTFENGDTYNLYAEKEVIVSAGAINSPKLLMLSGIGPKAHLESVGIEVLADLPVGQNFQDHPPAVVVYEMEESTQTYMPLNPHQFPLATFLGHVAFDPKQEYPDYMTINLVIPPGSPALLQLCANMIKLSNKICQKFHNANKDRTLLVVINGVMMPNSRGKILLDSADPNDYPLIYPGTFTDESDLTLLAKSLEDYHKVINTSYFKSVNASMVELNLCSCAKNETEFWICYAREMSATLWHFSGTCGMGTVLDSKLRVKGVDKLRVIDASSMPQLVRGKINAAVNMLAERGADIILSEWKIHN